MVYTRKKATKAKKVEKKPPDKIPVTDPCDCKDCENTITEDDPAIECDICKSFICLPCTEMDADVYNYLVEKEADVPYICKSCKEDIPKFRELLGLKTKYIKLQEEVTKLKEDLATQEIKITNYEANQKNLDDRLEQLEKTPFNTQFPALLEGNQPANQHFKNFLNNHVRPAVHTEMGEFEQIQAIKKNLVCSGIKESDSNDDTQIEEDDRISFVNLIKDEFNIVPAVEKVERCGRKRTPTDDDPTPKPRLLKIYIKDQRTRKDILSKAVTLRNSESDHVKQEVFIKPDQTIKQQKESKNLRARLKELRQQNQEKTYKIYRGEIKEIPTIQPEDSEEM